MKVTFLLTAADAMSDAERAVFNQAAELAALGYEVSVLSVFKVRRRRFVPPDDRVGSGFLIEAGGATHRPVRDSGLDEARSAALASVPSAIVERRCDNRFNRLADVELEYALQNIVTDVLVTTSPGLMAYAAAFVPTEVLTVHHEQRAPELGGPEGEPLLTHTPRFDAVTFPSPRSYEWFMETFGAGNPQLDVIPPAPLVGFRPRSTLQTRIVVLSAPLVERAGLVDALKAWAAIAPIHPTWSLRIIGEGPQIGLLRRRRDQLGLHGSVHFISEAPYLAEEWAKASIALCTSESEAGGLSLMEAQAAGVPVVAYDCPNAPRDVVQDGRTGILVTPGDTDALTAVLTRLIEDDALRHSLGSAAFEAAGRFDAAAVTSRWDGLFRLLAAARASGSRAEAKAARLAAHALHAGNDGAARAAAAAPASTSRTKRLRATEERILKHDGSLVRDGGQICRVIDSESPFEISSSNLGLTADALERARIPYFAVRDTKVRHSVAVHVEYRDEVLKVLAETYPGAPVYIALLNDSDSPTLTTLAELAGEHIGATFAGVRVYQSAVTASRTMRLSGAYGCTISFWEEDPEDPEFFVSPTRTLIGARVPRPALRQASLLIGGRTYPSIEPFAQTLHHDYTFPIDVVYTWVDGADLAWLERKNAALSAMGIVTEDAATSAARFRNRDELRYSMRSLDMYGPWIRNIYVITDQQVPTWLDTSHPRVRVVDHSEIFGMSGSLPTYNSHAIESRMHHIEGLAEHFLYFNDDIFLGRPVQPSLFYLSNGQAKHFASSNAIPMSPITEGDEFSRMAAKNNRELIRQMFGRTLVNSFVHAPHPLRRSIMFDLESHFPEAMARTSHSQLRSPTDLSTASSLHHYFGYYTERSVPGGLSAGFVNVGLSEQLPKLNTMLTARSNDTFCLNDFHDGDVSEDEQDAILAGFLPSYFPIASQFEFGSPRNQRYHAGRLPGYPL